MAQEAAAIAARAPEELRALVGVSTPSGDVAGFDRAAALAVSFAPRDARVERPACSSPDHAADLLLRLTGGTGTARLLLVGHLDTVVAHTEHRPLTRDNGRLVGSGSLDMKGGNVLALGVLRALAGRRGEWAEVALLLVADEEWRTAPFRHADRFAGWDACLCFEAGEHDAEGREAVIVERKAAGTIVVRAEGVPAHSGSAPWKGRSALLALAAAAQAVAACDDPDGPDRLTAVPTLVRAGEAINVVPASGELTCDVRARTIEAIERVLDAVPPEVGGARLHASMARRWPGMDTRAATAPVLELAAEGLGRPVVASRRGGASDASHLAGVIPVTLDGLGPIGGGAHAPHEHVLAQTLRTRAEVALAVTLAALGR